MAEASPFDPRPEANIEDRRQEFTPWQHFLMELGIPPIDPEEGARREMGLQPGQYFDSGDFFDPRVTKSPLSRAAGIDDINAPVKIGQR